MQYDSIRLSWYWSLDHSSKLTEADKNMLLKSLLCEKWKYQDEMIYWLWHEQEVYVSQSTISRVLKQNKWTRKELQCICLNQNENLREAYQDDICQFMTDDLVFLDESIFNKKMGWRHQAYVPIENEIRYNALLFLKYKSNEIRYDADVRQEHTWSICTAMTLNDWLLCTDIKKSYFNTEDFLNWLHQFFLLVLQENDDDNE